ncbi:prephenate dehydrogenase [Sulfuriroseicoccus oceanibius]|uniref:Prephenate dehydrogenase/arogenate dehydrogenase family protein n=1 Tax=Sulfuriroseicoccus oceanibius TaxID=2707525 RepID=A0A6B3L424_9BACT|nr:prephenate dehydrogenase/arogenate dehydrogenase family protein [Sulfuriroseicoccus oceanibius]QQL46233.1 prephenate dehydrogenase/arogenate dehydrogenase family protein [Sulfuriroseicoccus oceanibius]
MKCAVKSVAVIGPGVLGGSLALALSDAGLEELRLWGRREAALDGAIGAGFSGRVTTDFEEAVRGVQLVVLAVPVGVMPDLARRIANLPESERPLWVTDVGSVKGSLAGELPAVLDPAGVSFVGAHPMCGSEQSGIGAADRNLFRGARCFVCPGETTSDSALEVVRSFWSEVGCEVHSIDAAEHDAVVAKISHLPHVLAAVAAIGALREDTEMGRFAGNGLRDTSRVASGGVAMWTEILLENQQAVAEALKEAGKTLEAFEQAVAQADAARLTALLAEAKALRDDLATL